VNPRIVLRRVLRQPGGAQRGRILASLRPNSDADKREAAPVECGGAVATGC